MEQPTLSTEEFRRWTEGTRFHRVVERMAQRLARKFGVIREANNYWDLHQEIAALAVEMFRNGTRPLDGERTAWLRRLAYDAAGRFAAEFRREARRRSLDDAVAGDHREVALGAAVEDPRTRFTREYLRVRGAEFLAREVEGLPPMYQQVFLLVEVEGKTIKEASRIAQVPYRTMVSRHQAALRLLQRRLVEYLDDMTREPE